MIVTDRPEPVGLGVLPHALGGWRRIASSWIALVVVGIVALASVLGGLWLLRDAAGRRQAIEAESQQLPSSRGTAPVPPPVTADSDTDFTRRLPAAVSAETFVAELQRAGAGAGVAIGSVQVQHQSATRDQLGRDDVAVSLRGSYPQVKQTLAEALARFPNATMRRMSLRRLPPIGDVEASVVVALWARPAPEER